MDILYRELWVWTKNVLFSMDLDKYWYWQDFLNISKDGIYHFFFLNIDQYRAFFKHDIIGRVSYDELNRQFLNNVDLQKYYDTLFMFIINKGIQHIVFYGYGQYWHPVFLKKLKDNNVVISLFTGDDDTSNIKYISLPYTRYYDYHFHISVMYNKKITIAEKFKMYNSKNPIRLPLGAIATHINHNIDFGHRDIDVCYIGNVNPLKFFRLSKLKKHFWNKFKLYGWQWNGDWKSLKWIFYKIANKLFGLWYIERLSDEKLCDVYRRTKIWINMHLVSYKWPSNHRTYELPINGVMQITDNELWVPKIFKVWEEIICYKNMKDAIRKIDYYLSHEEERVMIAKKWYERAIRENYTLENTFRVALDMLFGIS